MNTVAEIYTMVSAAFTTAAFHWAASPKRFPDLGPIHTARRLFYNTTNFFFPGRPLRRLSRTSDRHVGCLSVQHRKFDAFRAHTSLHPAVRWSSFGAVLRNASLHEFYTPAATPEPQPAAQTTDLFAGL